MLNKVMLIGNLGADPVMNYTPSGSAVTKFRIAVSRYRKNSSGDRQEETEWFNIVSWEKLAETCNQYLRKGLKVYVEGRLTQRKYTDRDGVEKYMVEIIANDMQILTPKSAQSSSSESFLGEQESGDPLGDLDEHPF